MIKAGNESYAPGQGKRNKKTFPAGLTLVELMVTAAILIILASGILMVLAVANKSWYTDMGILDLQQGVRFAMDGMVREIRQSDPWRSITIGAGGDSLQFYIANVTDPIIYSLANNQTIRQHPDGVNKILANNISEIDFCWKHGNGTCTATRSNSYSLQVQLRATKTVRQQTLTFPKEGPLVEEVKLRNE